MTAHGLAAYSLVTFKNSQGVDARGTLIKLTRSSALFEVYNPYSIIQLSEVLNDLTLRRGDRAIYSGRGVVSTLVNTGLMIIAEVTLVDGWQDLKGITNNKESLQQEIKDFFEQWNASHNVTPEYQLAVSEIRSFLAEYSRWLEQLDVQKDSIISSNNKDELVAEIFEPSAPRFWELAETFERAASGIPPEELVVYRSYAQRDLHPYLMSSPFLHRAYQKPLGYAGDYQMVDMMVGSPHQGHSIFSNVLNTFALNLDVVKAHRNRIDVLLDRIIETAISAARSNTKARILNIGCGPAEEIQRFIRSHHLANRCAFWLLDFNDETLEYAESKIRLNAAEANATPELTFAHQSVHNLLKLTKKGIDPKEFEKYDLVYCAGLFDYLSDKVCSRLLDLFHDWTKPGGTVLATNVHPRNPTPAILEHILEWHLIYRNESQMTDLYRGQSPTKTFCEETGVNVFLEIQKPALAQ